MFVVLFEVNPASGLLDSYLNFAKALRPELEQIDGFIENVRYGSLQREGWLLSVSSWRDEKAVVRWRTKANHHQAQATGRSKILGDYHLRVGQFTADTQLPRGQELREQRLDATDVGAGQLATLITARRPDDWKPGASAADSAKSMGLDRDSSGGLVDWDIYEAILTPGDLILMLVWKDQAALDAFANRLELTETHRVRHVRIIRDYGMYDRREAPQYYPEVEKKHVG
jgi:heme-degrading monooxygenase HmoA